MTFKYFKDKNNNIFNYPLDKSQDHLIGDKTQITEKEFNEINQSKFVDLKQRTLSILNYSQQRALSYPPMQDFVDAWVKNDEEALEDYRQKCLDVKKQFPKPEGS